MARAFGATDPVNARTEDAQARIREIAESEGVDYAVEAAGRSDTIEQAFLVPPAQTNQALHVIWIKAKLEDPLSLRKASAEMFLQYLVVESSCLC